MGLRITGVAVVMTLLASAADAQRAVPSGSGAVYPPPEPTAFFPPLPQPPLRPIPARRWSDSVDGRWQGGAEAPGGWSAYRTPRRGHRLPAYWAAPRFAIADWATYGLQPPPQGYGWSRYYDDAVLIDGRGSVHDSVGGLDWDSFDARRENDGRADMEVDARRNGSGPGYPPPPHHWVSHDGSTTLTVTTAGTPAYAPPVAYGCVAALKTITMQSQPAVTTSTEIVEDSATYMRPLMRRVGRKPVSRPAPRRACGN